MTVDPLEFLRATLDVAQARAEATTDGQPYDEWTSVTVEGDSDAARSVGEVAFIAHRATTTPANRAIMQHIAANDPAAVLRRIAADRKIIDDCDDVIHDFTHGALRQLAADTIRILAEGWGWTGETT